MLSSTLHLHPLDYSLDNLKCLTNQELALVQFHPDIDDQHESTLLKVHRMWSNRREKYRVKSFSEEAVEKDSLLSIEFSFSLNDLSTLTSEQLSVVQFHPDVNELIQLKAEKVWRSRREKDLLKGLIWKNERTDSISDSIATLSTSPSPFTLTSTILQQDYVVDEISAAQPQPVLQLHSSIASTSKLTIEDLPPLPLNTIPIVALSSISHPSVLLPTKKASLEDHTSNFDTVDLSSLPPPLHLPILPPPISSTVGHQPLLRSTLPSRPILYPAKPSGRTKIPKYTAASDQIYSIRLFNLCAQEIRSLDDLRFILPDRLVPEACVLLGGRPGSRVREGFLGWSSFDRRAEALKVLACTTLRGTRFDAAYVGNQDPQWEWRDLTSRLADRLWQGDCDRKRKVRETEAGSVDEEIEGGASTIASQLVTPEFPLQNTSLAHSAPLVPRIDQSHIPNHTSPSQDQPRPTTSLYSPILQACQLSQPYSKRSASLPFLPFSSSRVPLHLIEPLFPMTLSFTILPPSLQHAITSPGSFNFNMIKQIYACRPLPPPQFGFYFLFSDRASRVAAKETFERMNFKGGEGQEITPDGPDVESWEWDDMERSFRAVNCPANYFNGSLINISSSISTSSSTITTPVIASTSSLSHGYPSSSSSAIRDSPLTPTSPNILPLPLNQLNIHNSPSTASGNELLMQSDHSVPDIAPSQDKDFDESLDTEGHVLPVGWIRIGSLQHESRFFYYNHLEDQRIWENPNTQLKTPTQENQILEEAEVEGEAALEEIAANGTTLNSDKIRSASLSSDEDELESLEVEKQLAIHTTSRCSPPAASTTLSTLSNQLNSVAEEETGAATLLVDSVTSSVDEPLPFRPIKKKYKSPSNLPINFAPTSHIVYQDPPSYLTQTNSYHTHSLKPLESTCAAPSLLARTIALKIQGSASSSSLADRIQDNSEKDSSDLAGEPLAGRLVNVSSSKYKGKGKGKRFGERIDSERGGKKRNRGGLLDRLA